MKVNTKCRILCVQALHDIWVGPVPVDLSVTHSGSDLVLAHRGHQVSA